MDILRIAARVAKASPACLYVDLDETLVHTVRRGRHDDERIESLLASGLEHAEIGGAFVSFLRPGARDFLLALRGLGGVSLCTAANRPYADDVLAAFGLNALIDDVVSSEDFSGVRASCGTTVLVDNLPVHASDIEAKLRAIGVGWDPEDPSLAGLSGDERFERKLEHGSRHHVKVKDFWGDPSDRGLAAALSAVRNLVSSAAAA